jgi:glycosyltransferase involved in cell wall biosynthesis
MPMRCVVVTNVPTPYRAPVWEILGGIDGLDLHVVYCAAAHIDPSQDGRSTRYQTHFLSGRYQAMDNRFFHADWSTWRLLDQIRPDVVITSGFIPTFLYAFAWSVVRRVPHVPMTDGTDESEKSLTWKHRWVRRLVFAFSRSFIGACEGSRRLYEGYGVKPARIHLAPLCTDNSRFSGLEVDKEVDLIFCGRFVEHKNPIMAMDVACGVARRLGRRVSLRFVGQGGLEARMREHAHGVSEWVEVSFAGYLSQNDLPSEYARARVFVFPTAFDPWGVVVNEACAAGVPCVVSPHTGVAGELIRDGVSGFVCALGDLHGWIERCSLLLSDLALWERVSLAARDEVSAYTFERSAKGVCGALSQAVVGGEECLGR